MGPVSTLSPCLCSQGRVLRSREEAGFSLSWWGGAPGPTPHPRPYPGASRPGSTPCSLLEHRGRVAGLQLHVSTWAECQGAGPGLGMGPAGETGQLGKSGGSRGGSRGKDGGPLGGMPTKAWHLKAQAPKSGFKSQLTSFLAVWLYASRLLSEPQFHSLENEGSTSHLLHQI